MGLEEVTRVRIREANDRLDAQPPELMTRCRLDPHLCHTSPCQWLSGSKILRQTSIWRWGTGWPMKVNHNLCETPNQIPFSLLPWGESCLVSEGPSHFPNLWLISLSTIPPRLYLVPFLCVLLREPKLTHPLSSITSWWTAFIGHNPLNISVTHELVL